MQTDLHVYGDVHGPDALVTGATGLIGRWLVPELTRRGRRVLVLMRGAGERLGAYQAWVDQHGGVGAQVGAVDVDLEGGAFTLPQPLLAGVRDVFHSAARFAFGLSREEARRVNVEGSLRLLELCAAGGGLRRFVQLSGYRVGSSGLDVADEAALAGLYRELGAYEASKVEENLRVQARARALGVALTVINPGVVVGDARTGETTQVTGLGELVGQLYAGQMPALVGSPRAHVPVVSVDYVARFAAAVVERADTAGQSYTLLDQRTPPLHGLIKLIARHMGVEAPRLAVPRGLVAALPEALTGVSREALSFISTDRYDTANAEQVAAQEGLVMAPVEGLVTRWVDHLVSTRFGAAPEAGGGRLLGGEARVFGRGEVAQPGVVWLHGLPLDSASWDEVRARARVAAPSLVLDLPGMGASGAGDPLAGEWLDGLWGPAPVALVGHSLGAAVALRWAIQRPERVSSLVLIAPPLLGPRPAWWLRVPELTQAALRMGQRRLPSMVLGQGAEWTPALQSAAAALGRRGTRRAVARAVAAAASPKARASLHALLARAPWPVTVVVGSREPLRGLDALPASVKVVTVEGAGHYPQLTHPDAVAAALTRHLSA